VDIGDVDPRKAEPLQAVLDGTHRAVMGIVVVDVEGQGGRERTRRARRLVGAQQPSDLGRQHETVPRDAAQAFADTVL
jgi:hypothetical protein